MGNKKDSLGDRMKGYEKVSKHKLVNRMPVIIRLDGKSFHTFTRRFERPFDHTMHYLMTHTTERLCADVQNVVFGYTQSDEISLLIKDWTKLNTDQWFDNNIQKMVSVAASLATGYFNRAYQHQSSHEMTEYKDIAFFDARIFNIPEAEVVNYFIWRQQDATRNSVQMLARAHFSHKQLHKKNNNVIQDMLMLEKKINWNDLDTWKKRGTGMMKTGEGWMEDDVPIFTQDREYLGDLLRNEDD